MVLSDRNGLAGGAGGKDRTFGVERKVIADEEDYIRRNIAGQNTKQAKGRRKRLNRMPRLSGPTSEEGSAMGLRLDLSERGGDQVAIARDVTITVEGRTLINQTPWLLALPIGCIIVTVLGFNLLGDGLRASLDPVQRR